VSQYNFFYNRMSLNQIQIEQQNKKYLILNKFYCQNHSTRCWLWVGCQCVTFLIKLVYGFMIQNTNRSFGELNRIDEDLLKALSLVFSLCNCLFKLLIGYLFDKISFKSIFLVMTTLEVIIILI
jgi:hypothetical protein